jgi:hypothetical protein
MLETSPRVKHSVIIIKKPRVPFTATPDIMARGRVSEAFLISSAVRIRLGQFLSFSSSKTGECHLHM